MAIFGQGFDNKVTSVYVNGAVISTSSYAIAGNGTIPPNTNNYDRRNTIIEVNSGTLSAIHEAAIYHPQDGTLRITGGTLTGVTGVEMRAGTMIMTGGTISATGVPVSSTGNTSGPTTIGAGISVVQHTTGLAINVTISGGTIEGYAAIYEAVEEDYNVDPEAISISLTGGTFTATNGGSEAVAINYSNKVVVTATVTGGSYSSDVSAYVSSDVDVKWIDGVMYVGDSIPSTPVIIPDNRTPTTPSATTTDSSSDDSVKVVACAAAAVAAALMVAFVLILSKKN